MFWDKVGELGNALVGNFSNATAMGAAQAAQANANANISVINAQTAQQAAIKAAETKKMIVTVTGIGLMIALLGVFLLAASKK